MSKNIVLLATDDHGGAGEAAVRVGHALRKLGHNAVLLVKSKTKNDKHIIQVANEPRRFVKRTAYKVYGKVQDKFKSVLSVNRATNIKTDYNYYFFNRDETVGFRDISLLTEKIPFKPDIIIACWVTNFINTRNLYQLSKNTGATAYWLTMDMSPMTGGCHYAWDCLGYTKGCANCPAILTDKFKQVAHENLAQKIRYQQLGNIQVLAASEWCRRQATASTLFGQQKQILVLNGPVDQSIFNDRCRNIAKQLFGVAATDKLLFTGATYTHEKRKGIDYLIEALQLLHARLPAAERDRTKIMVAGGSVLENDLVRRIPFTVVPVDYILDERLLSLAYQAADVFVCSSIEDSGPAMVNQALACGTPVVGFEMGFVADTVIHGRNGFRVPLKDVATMAQHLHDVLALSAEEATSFSRNAIQVIDEKVSLAAMGSVIAQLGNQAAQVRSLI